MGLKNNRSTAKLNIRVYVWIQMAKNFSKLISLNYVLMHR